MRHCFTLIGLICVVSFLFAVEASATSPFADALPDIRMIKQSGGSPDTAEPAFDLDNYVIDYDETDDVLTWGVSVTGPSVTIDTSSAQSALHEADMFAHSTAGQYDADFTVTDKDAQTGTSPVTSTLKYSSFFLTEPKFTADNRLSFKGAGKPRFTHVKLFDGSGSAEITPTLSGYLYTDIYTSTKFNPLSATFGPLIVHDLDTGAPVEVARGNSVTYGGLAASIDTANGAVTLTPSTTLSCAVLISIPAVLEGDTFGTTGDWDGSVMMVAPAKEIETYPAWTYGGESLKQTCRFEDIPTNAPIPPDGAGSSTHNTKITGSMQIQGLGVLPMPTFSVISSLPTGTGQPGEAANQFDGATSGNAVKINCNNSGGSVMFGRILSHSITPVQPGEVYGVSLNISTDIPSAQSSTFTDKIRVKFYAASKPDQGLWSVYFRGKGSGSAPVSLPTDGKWSQMYLEYIVPEVNTAVEDSGGDPVNLADKGFFVGVDMFVDPTTPQFNVYCDNFYVYNKGMSDLNITDVNDASGGLVEEGLANGVTAIDTFNHINPSTNGTMLDTGFESGSTLDDNNWLGPSKPAVANVAVTTATASIAGFSRLPSPAGAACLSGQIVSGLPAGGENDGCRVNARQIAVAGVDNSDVAITGAVDNSGEGIYGVSFWVASNASHVKDNASVKVDLFERKPTINQMASSILVGPSLIPLDLEWVQYSFIGPFGDLGSDRAMKTALLNIEFLAHAFRAGMTSLPGEFGTAGTIPGEEADETIYVDDLNLHRVSDNDQYWNSSLFD
jgi:hypothetical protein